MPEATAMEPPVFVLCTPRSGSTLLRFVLDTHPAICAPSELFLADTVRVLERLLSATAAGWADGGAAADRERQIHEEARRTVERYMDRYARSHGKRMWVDKSPTETVRNVRLIEAVFPHARFISLHRDCLDFIHSSVELNKLGWIGAGVMGDGVASYLQRSPENLVEALARFWIDISTLQLEFERTHPASCFRVTYESLVLDSERTVRGLFAFLGVAWEEGLLGKVFQQDHGSGYGDKKIGFTNSIHAESVGRGAAQMPIDMLSVATRERIAALREAIGYPPGGYAPTVRPPAATVAAAPHAVTEFFEVYLPRRLRELGVPAKPISVKFVVEDLGGLPWLLDLAVAGGRIERSDGEATCTIALVADTLVALATARLNPLTAFSEGALRVTGDRRVLPLVYRLLIEPPAVK